LLARCGLPVPKGEVAGTPGEARDIAAQIGGPVAVKSQVLVSGRGKAGGILFADTPAEASMIASHLIGSTIKDTPVRCVLLEEKLDIAAEFYASVAIDRDARRYVVLASSEGGVDIEDVARDTPDRILRQWIEPGVGLDEPDAERMLQPLAALDDGLRSRFASFIALLYRVVRDCDAELVELNPLVQTASGDLVAADARMILDDNALYRHPEFEERSLDRSEDTPREAEARRQGLTYVDLPGDIGIVGNGAGLVMATMDTVHHFGGRAASFLDIGGGAQTDAIKRGLMLVMSKPEVRAVFFNIHGGITRCDVAAEGIILALREAAIRKPLVVRMMGTNGEQGVKMLHQAGIEAHSDMDAAAEAVVKL